MQQLSDTEHRSSMLSEAINQFMRDALVAIAGAVCTPEKGYLEDGGLQLLLADVRRLRKQHDAAVKAATHNRDGFEEYERKYYLEVNAREAAEARAEQLAEALGKVWRATNTPDHKRNDTEWLRAATSIAYSFADAALSPAPTTDAKGAADGQ